MACCSAPLEPDYLYHAGGSQCIEERKPGPGTSQDDPQKQYVFGRYIDECIQQKHLVTINGKAAGDYYPLSDLLYRTMALTNSSGTIVEAYDTDAYGNTLIFSAAGTGENWWANNATVSNVPTCEFIFTGRRFDAETKIYFYRARYYVPSQGRFISRDPLRYYNGMSLYQFIDSLPIAHLDPLGRSPTKKPRKHLPFTGTTMSPEDCQKAKQDRKQIIETRKKGKQRKDPGDCLSPECQKVTIVIELPHACLPKEPGHSGVAFEDRYYDFGPQGGAKKGETVPGTWWWDDPNPAGPNFPDPHPNIDSPWDVGLDDIRNNIYPTVGRDIFEIAICMCKQDAVKAEAFWIDLYKQIQGGTPPNYSAPGLHCTSAVCKSLFPGHATPHTTTPAQFFLGVVEMTHSCGPNKGNPVDFNWAANETASP